LVARDGTVRAGDSLQHPPVGEPPFSSAPGSYEAPAPVGWVVPE
jgi:hypothetical protein